MNTDPTRLDRGQPESCEASAAGILGCLHMLAAEASSLRLPHTVQALRGAIDACVRERSGALPARH